MRRRAAVAVTVAAVLCSCQTVQKVDDTYAKRQQEADKLMAEKPPAAPAGSVIHSPKPILGVLEAPAIHGDPLPKRCDQPLTLRVASPLTLAELAARLRQEGIPIQTDPRIDYDPDDKQGGTGGAAASAAPVPQVETAAFEGFPFNGRLAVGATATPFRNTMAANFSGTCDDILDAIASRFDLTWRVRGGVVSFDKYETRTFPINASATTTKMTSSITSGGNASAGGGSSGTSGGVQSSLGGSQGGGGSTQSASADSSIDIWADIDNGLKSLMPKGGHYSISKAAGSVTVMATPRAMNDIAAYIGQINAVLSATVSVEVSALYITVSDADNYGLDLNALYQAGTKGGLTGSLQGLLPTLSTTPGTGSLAILSPPAGVSANNFSTHFAGSQIFLSAVSSAGRTADFRTATVTGRNGVAMPVTLTTNQDIVRSIQLATGLQTGTTAETATTSTINYGFTLEVLPRIIAPNTVSVFLSFGANDLTNLTTFQVGNAGSLELATIDNRSFNDEIPLVSGQTMVVCGTEQDKVSRQDSGLGEASNWLFGGSRQGTVTRTRLILLVTPTIMAVVK